MNEEQRQWFAAFADTKRREVQAINEGGDNRIWKFISDHYSDKAHFLYELIQNADDAGASEATFELYSDPDGSPSRGRLVFRHNGCKHFTINKAAPKSSADYEIARKNRTLDSVYSICTVGNSTKETNDIGKFGIGFKSVFLYTESPRIYDDDGVRFEITDFVVPKLLEKDFVGRRDGETVFDFPFNRKGGDHLPQNPCADILGKLRTLILPTLFLKHLEKVSWIFGSMSGHYSTTRQQLFVVTDETNRKTYINEALAERKDGDEETLDEFVLVDRLVDQESALNLTIGFKIDNGELIPANYAPFCYFATQVSFGLKFIVNAPFILTSTRQSLDFSSDESMRTNQKMMDGLSSLLADSLLYLRDLGRTSPKHCYLSETIFKILPLGPDFVPQNERDKLNIRRNDRNDYFDGFYSKPLHKFQQEEIIPCSNVRGEYCRCCDAYYAKSKNIADRFTDEDLVPVAERRGNQGQTAHWVYSQTYDFAHSEHDCEANRYIESIGATGVDAKMIIESMQGQFILGKQGCQEWLKNFYEWLSDQPDRIKDLGQNLSLLLNQNLKPVSAFINGQPNLYVPNGSTDEMLERESDVFVVHRMLHQWDCVQRLERAWNISKLDAKARSEMLIHRIEVAQVDADREINTVQLMWLLADWNSITETIGAKMISALRKYGVLKAKNGVLRPLQELYRYSEAWHNFTDVAANASQLFVDREHYASTFGEERFIQILDRIGIGDKPSLIETDWIRLPGTQEDQKYLCAVQVDSCDRPLRYKKILMPALDMLLDTVSTELEETRKKQCERDIWRILFEIASGDPPEKCFDGEYVGTRPNVWVDEGYARRPDNEVHKPFVSLILKRLQTSKWIVRGDGELASPAEVTTIDLGQEVRSNPAFGQVCEWLEIRVGANSALNKFGNTTLECLALSDEWHQCLASLQYEQSSSPFSPSTLLEEANVFSIKSYLSLNLRIPWYQRPYEWTKRNVVELLDDICEAQREEKKKYRIGSIILHIDKDGICNIVDGQQRTLTLLLVLCKLLCDGGDRKSSGAANAYLRLLSSNEFYPALSQCKVSRRNLRNNFVHIDDYFRMHSGSEESVLNALENQLEVVVVCVKEQTEAFQLFDSQNSKGRPLDPHDLLKAFHLRHFSKKQGFSSEQIYKRVEDWESRVDDIGILFNELLYRIYKWNRKEKCERFTTQDIGAFKGIPMSEGGKGVRYGYVERAYAAKCHFQIGEPIIPGEEFFLMVSHYLEMLQAINERIGKSQEVQNAQDHCGSSYLPPLFRAVLLDYFDRFGFEDSDPELAIQNLCKWAFAVRLDVEYLGPKTPNRYALGPDGTPNKYTNFFPMFYIIKTAVMHTEVTNIHLNIPSFDGTGEDGHSELRSALQSL